MEPAIGALIYHDEKDDNCTSFALYVMRLATEMLGGARSVW